jgi:hypothetical protein
LTGFAASVQVMGMGACPQDLLSTQIAPARQQPEPHTVSAEVHWRSTIANMHMPFAHVAPVGQQLAPQPTGKFAGQAPPEVGVTLGVDANLTLVPVVKSLSRRRRPLLFGPPVVALFEAELPHPSAMQRQSALAHPIPSVY